MNEIMALLAGVGLAAASGLRVFVPLFITSLMASGNATYLARSTCKRCLEIKSGLLIHG